jgi:hypothetical protein
VFLDVLISSSLAVELVNHAHQTVDNVPAIPIVLNATIISIWPVEPVFQLVLMVISMYKEYANLVVLLVVHALDLQIHSAPFVLQTSYSKANYVQQLVASVSSKTLLIRFAIVVVPNVPPVQMPKIAHNVLKIKTFNLDNV